MRPNVMQGGSMARGEEAAPSAVRSFSRMRNAGVKAAGRMAGESVTRRAQMAAQQDLNFRQSLVDMSVQMFRPRGYAPGAAPAVGVSSNQGAFDAIGRALGEIVGFNRGGQAPRSSGSSSPGPRTYWQPRGDDGWGNTQLGTRGSNESMASKAIAGFSFL